MMKTRRNSDFPGKENKATLKDIEELVLPTSKLKFCSEQLQNLNYIFNEKSQRVNSEKTLELAKSVTERLIQRLLCGIGLLDQRFASKFLITLHTLNETENNSTKLKYLIRLDGLSQPTLYPGDDPPKYFITEGDLENCPTGYARIRLHTSCVRNWLDFVNSTGYLRRDRIQARFVELLAQAAASGVPSTPLEVDESILCGSPGKVVDAAVLNKILHTPPENHVFYGPQGNAPQFPDPRDFKLAIVDEPNGIKLRVGFLSPALSSVTIQVRLLIGIGIASWPSTTNFPFRVPLGHSDCLLYQTVAQTGMYLVGYGVHSLAWQMRMPAAESLLLHHYGPSSGVATVIRILDHILGEINEEHRKYEISHRILNNYILRNSVFFELENDNTPPTVTIMNWSPKYISTRILRILDKIIKFLRHERQPHYFFLSANLFLNPGHLSNEDFFLEARKIQAYLFKCFDESLISLRGEKSFKKFLYSQRAELSLLSKWKELIEGLTPPPSTRERRFSFTRNRLGRNMIYAQYSTRQMEYIGILLKNMLTVKQSVLDNQTPCEYGWIQNLPEPDSPVEDAIYILVTIIEQARTQHTSLCKNASKLKRHFDASTTKLVEAIRREHPENADLSDDETLVKMIVKWLHKGLEHNKTYFAPVLRPYLQSLFVSSHGISWHLETIKKGNVEEELAALGIFAKLINAGSITPAQGLVDSVNKRWEWARRMLLLVEEANLRLIFIPGRNTVRRHILSLPPCQEDGKGRSSLHNLKSSSGATVKNYFDSLRKSCPALANKTVESPKPYTDILRESSPMTAILDDLNRKGLYRCAGNIFETLIAMQRYNVLQEAAAFLPPDEQDELKTTMDKLVAERGRKTTLKKRPNSFIQLSADKQRREPITEQKYTPKEESAGVREEHQESTPSFSFPSKRWDPKQSVVGPVDDDSLIGSCRAARIRDDSSIVNFQENFRMKTLMKSASFKY